MGVIALYDHDLHCVHFCPPNIELMKLAAYHKRRGDMVVMVDEVQSERYTKVYCAQDYGIPDIYKFGTSSNVELIGDTINQHITNEAILANVPDTSIYIKYYNNINGADAALANRLPNIEHIQLSLDGKNLWDKIDTQFKGIYTTNAVMVHDKDITAIDGAYDKVNEILNVRPDLISLGVKYPITVYNSKQLDSWARIRAMQHAFVIKIKYELEYPQDIYTLTSLNRSCIYDITCAATSSDDYVKNHFWKTVWAVNNFSNGFGNLLLINESDFALNQPWLIDFLELAEAFVNYHGNKTTIGNFIKEHGSPNDQRIFNYIEVLCPKALEYL